MKSGNKKTKVYIWGASFLIAGAVLFLGVTVVRALVTSDEGKRKRQIQTVMLVKPPPPPKIEQKPPEMKKKEEIIEEEPQELPPEDMNEVLADEAPAGDQLGLDADGSAGGDAFGLLAKKGGRPLLGVEDNTASLLRKYAWYNRIVEMEIQRQLRTLLEKSGHQFDDNMKAEIEVHLNEYGEVRHFRIRRTSGDRTLDSMVEQALEMARIGEMKPAGMPDGMLITVSSRG